MFDVKTFNLRKLSELEVTKEYHIKISSRFAAFENLNNGEDRNRVWENIKKNIKILGKESLGLYVLKQHKPWFDEEHVRCLNQRKQTKIQWLQNPNQSRVDNITNVRREVLRHFRNKEKKIWKLKLMNLKLTVRSKILGTCIGVSMTLRRVTSLELVQ